MTFTALSTGAAAAILMTSGLVKLVDRERFERVLLAVPHFGPAAMMLSVAVPLVELGVAILLLFGKSTRVSLTLAAALLLTFAYVSATSHLDECGCGPLVPKRSKVRITVSLGLAVLAVYGSTTASTAPIGDRVLAFGSTVVLAMTINLVVGFAATMDERAEFAKALQGERLAPPVGSKAQLG